MIGLQRLRRGRPTSWKNMRSPPGVRQSLYKDYKRDRHLALILQREVASTTHRYVDLVGLQLEVMR